MQLTRETILQQAQGTTYEVVADEAILIHLDSGTYFSLNRVGTEFWEMLDGQKSISQHAKTIAAKYGVEQATVEVDLLELASEMVEDELVTSA